MLKRKLIGVNNFETRERTFMDYTDVVLRGYEDIYALDRDGEISTFRRIFIKNKLYNEYETKENPYSLDFQFVENGEWEEIEEFK